MALKTKQAEVGSRADQIEGRVEVARMQAVIPPLTGGDITTERAGHQGSTEAVQGPRLAKGDLGEAEQTSHNQVGALPL